MFVLLFLVKKQGEGRFDLEIKENFLTTNNNNKVFRIEVILNDDEIFRDIFSVSFFYIFNLDPLVSQTKYNVTYPEIHPNSNYLLGSFAKIKVRIEGLNRLDDGEYKGVYTLLFANNPNKNQVPSTANREDYQVLDVTVKDHQTTIQLLFDSNTNPKGILYGRVTILDAEEQYVWINLPSVIICKDCVLPKK